MVVASRQNLEDFCRARGLPIDAPAITTPTRDAAVGSGVSAAGPPARVAGASAVERPADTSIDPVTAPPPPVASRPVPDAPAPMASRPAPPAPTSGLGSHRVAWVVIAVVVLLAAVLFVLRSRSPRDTTTPAPAAAVPPPPAAQPAEPAPIEPTGPPKGGTSARRSKSRHGQDARDAWRRHPRRRRAMPELFNERPQLALRSAGRCHQTRVNRALHARQIAPRWRGGPSLVSRKRAAAIRQARDSRQRDRGVSDLQPANRDGRRLASGSQER